MNDDQFFLANAYLDGELTDDERRIAEADPAVMAEVESLRDLQARLRDVPEPEPEAREVAIGAAMAEFARQNNSPAIAASATAANSVRPGTINRPTSSRYLAIAAAVVAIGLLGVIVASVDSRGGDNDSAAEVADRDFTQSVTDEAASTEDPADTADTADDAADAGAVAESAVADEMSGDMNAEMSQDMSSDTAADMASEMSSEMADDMSSDMSLDSATVIATQPVVDLDPAYDTAQVGDRRPEIDVEAPITDDLQLGAYGTYLLEEQFAGRLPPTPNTQCPPELNILGEQDLVLNGVDTDAYIAVQEIQQRVLAVDRQTCIPVVDGPLFTPTAP